jgi:hypothetical protein
MLCPCCLFREPWTPQVCDACRWRLRRWLREVRELVVRLATPDVVVDVEGEPVVDERGEPTVVDEDGEPVVHRDPVAGALPAAAVAGESGQPHVSGSREASTPVQLAAVDLILSYRHTGTIKDTMVPKVRSWPDPDRYVVVVMDGRPARQQVWHREVVVNGHGDPVMVPAGDQVGELSVASLLDSWVQVWREHRAVGEGRPDPTVEALSRWLADRVDDACDDGRLIADFYAELRHLDGVLRAVNGLVDHDEHLAGVPCPACGKATLWRSNASEWIECASCPHLMSDGEYRRHIQWLASVRHRSDG